VEPPPDRAKHGPWRMCNWQVCQPGPGQAAFVVVLWEAFNPDTFKRVQAEAGVRATGGSSTRGNVTTQG
jgi:hypothetical protein